MVKACEDGVANIDVFDRKFRRVFAKRVLWPHGSPTRQHMAIGYADEPVMLAQHPSFAHEYANDGIGFTTLE